MVSPIQGRDQLKNRFQLMNNPYKTIYLFWFPCAERTEITYQGGLLVLDCSSYLNVQDFEVEYEVTDRDIGESIFLSLLAELNIPIRKTENKVKRFYERKRILDL